MVCARLKRRSFVQRQGGRGVRVIPLTLKQANELVSRLHRHHKPVVGHRFSIGCDHSGILVGAAIVGRPVARNSEQYSIAEVLRLVTDGTPNACSFLYGACARICREMGFEHIQTFVLDSESGISLVASGWEYSHHSFGGDWTSRNGRRTDQPMGAKKKYIKKWK